MFLQHDTVTQCNRLGIPALVHGHIETVRQLIKACGYEPNINTTNLEIEKSAELFLVMEMNGSESETVSIQSRIPQESVPAVSHKFQISGHDLFFDIEERI